MTEISRWILYKINLLNQLNFYSIINTVRKVFIFSFKVKFSIQNIPKLFLSDESVELLLKIIAQQKGLLGLYFGVNNLSSDATDKIMSTLKDSSSRMTIKELNLKRSNWDSASACESLASLIATAPAL